MIGSDCIDKFRGEKSSPILVIGDSLPSNETTKGNLSEILDRRHVIYKSIIIPIKYYMNEYMISKYGLKLPNDYKNRDDIFGFINGFERTKENACLLDKELVRQQLNSDNYKIVLCMGKHVFDEIISLLEKEYGYSEVKVQKQGGQIRELGRYFAGNISEYKKNIKNQEAFGRKLILPILHNSANLSFQFTDRFIEPDADNDKDYVSYNEYISEQIAEIMINDPEMRNYLVDLRNMNRIK